MSSSPDISLWIQRLERTPLPARRTSPDLLRQLQQSLRRPVDRVLCIAADVDPACDLMRQAVQADRTDFDAGLKLIRAMVPVRQLVIDARYARRSDSKYPYLDPTLLIRRALKRKLRSDAPPTDAGVLLLDAVTAIQLGRMARGELPGPLPVVIDDVVNQRRIRLNALPDRTVGDVLREARIDPHERLLREGPLMQERSVRPEMLIGQTELWLHVVRIPVWQAPESCTRCGECVVACPARIHPAALLEAAQRRDRTMAESFGISACVECGLCTHICPSRLPVLASIRQLRDYLTSQ